MILRRFLYLDAELTGEFLAQFEGGRFDEEQHTERGQQGRELGASVGASGVGAKAGRSRSSQDERSRTIRQTPESEFQRLTDLLENEGAIQFLEAFDEDIWSDVRRGEIVEIEADVTVATIHRLAEAAGQIGSFMELADLFGESLELDDEAEQGIKAITSLGQMTSKVPIIARPAGSSDYAFIASLEPSKLRVDSGELEGEATFVCKIQRKLRPGEEYSFLANLPLLSALPRQQRRQALSEMKNSDDLPDIVLSAPGAVVTPIALFR